MRFALQFISSSMMKDRRLSHVYFGTRLEKTLKELFPYFGNSFWYEDIRLVYVRKMMIHPHFIHIKSKLSKTFSSEAAQIRSMINAFISSLESIMDTPSAFVIRNKIVNNVLAATANSNFRDALFEAVKGVLSGLLSSYSHFTFICVGCGMGEKEALIKEYIGNNFPDITTTWVGLDFQNYQNTFFHADPNVFFHVPSGVTRANIISSLSSITRKKKKAVILIAIGSIHHMERSIEEVYKLFPFSGSVIYEEPITDEFLNSFLLYGCQTAYDLLVNYSFGGIWADSFMKDPFKFSIRYPLLHSFKKGFYSKEILKRSPRSYIYWQIAKK